MAGVVDEAGRYDEDTREPLFGQAPLGSRRIQSKPPEPKFSHPEIVEEYERLKAMKEDLEQRFKDLEKEHERLEQVTSPRGAYSEILRIGAGDGLDINKQRVAMELICQILARNGHKDTADEFRTIMKF